MMMCDRCGKHEATIFIRREGAGESALCDLCAREQGITAEDGRLHISLEELFSAPQDSSDRPGYRSTCSVCGMHLEEVRKTGRVGCPECFSSFRTEILSFLKRRGRGGEYRGSVPRRFAASGRRGGGTADPEAYARWESELAQALSAEDYEKAARIRDRMRGLGGSAS